MNQMLARLAELRAIQRECLLKIFRGDESKVQEFARRVGIDLAEH